ncbi:hypothetical protein B0H13DRAFT_2275168 [Mycena leptocephala]|nr:hypothetical protein B0H13DRAFT_2275168 [Mycena leptocephala]
MLWTLYNSALHTCQATTCPTKSLLSIFGIGDYTDILTYLGCSDVHPPIFQPRMHAVMLNLVSDDPHQLPFMLTTPPLPRTEIPELEAPQLLIRVVLISFNISFYPNDFYPVSCGFSKYGNTKAAEMLPKCAQILTNLAKFNMLAKQNLVTIWLQLGQFPQIVTDSVKPRPQAPRTQTEVAACQATTQMPPDAQTEVAACQATTSSPQNPEVAACQAMTQMPPDAQTEIAACDLKPNRGRSLTDHNLEPLKPKQ